MLSERKLDFFFAMPPRPIRSMSIGQRSPRNGRTSARSSTPTSFFVGHTHIPFIRSFNRQILVNPGSLGQPKTGKPDACYAVWENGQVSLRTYAYPIDKTIDKIRLMPIGKNIQQNLIRCAGIRGPAPRMRTKTRMSKIVSLDALEILDSRGNPTIQVVVSLDSGATGIAKVPSGASTGKNEAVELRDGDKKRYGGKGVRKAVDKCLEYHSTGRDRNGCFRTASPRREAHCAGWNAEQGSSRAQTRFWVSRSRLRKRSASERKEPLYRYLAERETYVLPVPMFNVLNGGRHADNNVDFQEFMIAPVGASTFSEALQSASETFHALKDTSAQEGIRNECRR